MDVVADVFDATLLGTIGRDAERCGRIVGPPLMPISFASPMSLATSILRDSFDALPSANCGRASPNIDTTVLGGDLAGCFPGLSDGALTALPDPEGLDAMFVYMAERDDDLDIEVDEDRDFCSYNVMASETDTERGIDVAPIAPGWPVSWDILRSM